MFEKVSDLYLGLPTCCLWEFTFWLHTSNKLKKLQLKASMNGKIVREVWWKAWRRKGYPGTWQHEQVGQGCHFAYKAFPSVLLTIWRFYSPSFALILYSVLITKSSPFFFRGTCWQDAAKLKCDTHLAPFPPFFFSKVASVLVKTCCLRGFIQETKERAAEFGGSVCEKIGDWNKNTWFLYVVFLYTSCITCLANPLWISWIF